MAKRRQREDCKDPNPEYPTQLYCVRPPGHKRGPHRDVLEFSWQEGAGSLIQTQAPVAPVRSTGADIECPW